MFSPVTHFTAITTIRRRRFLPVPGRVLVRRGQKVAASEPIAEANLAPEHFLLDIARGLGVSAGKADIYIQRHAGDEVSEGDIVAGPVGLGRRVVRAPKDGRIVVAGGGQVLMEIASPPFVLKAGIPGVVTELFENQGAEIETTGSIVQGVWGNGRIDTGLLNALARSAQDPLTPDRLDVSQRGAVLLCGTCSDPASLAAAAEIPIRGLILASMDTALIPVAQKMRYPIIVVEGLGNLPMNPVVYKLLSTSDRRDVAVNAEAWDRLGNNRPEVVIPLPTSSQLPLSVEVVQFTAGQKVRVIGALHKVLIGTLATVRPGISVLPNGARAPAADVKLETGENMIVPLANLEVVQ